ncbi:MAG: M13 family metallopeptidase N-terminal domain-containing protein, partial [Saprospiraceae bacterium]
MKYIFSLIIVGLLCLNACKNKSAEAGKSQVFIDAANFDTLTKPGDDFFQYANGAWLKNTEIPADKSRWGSFNILREEAQEKIKTIIDEVSKQKDAKKGTPAQQIADLYNAAMDTVALDKAGFDPIKPTLDKIKNLKDVNELVKAVASAYESGMTGSPFSMYVYADDKNSNQVMVNMVQGGTALPSKDYYVKTDEKTKAIREKYNQYIANIFKLIGVDAAAAAKNAKTVLIMETRLANASKFPDEMRDPIANYNKLPKAAVDKLLSNINGVSSYLENAQLKNVDSINVPNPKYYQEVNNMFKSVSLDDWKTYLTYQTVNEAATYLSKPFRDEKFDFFSKTMTGVKEQKPRWKQAVDLVENSLGEPLGKLYAEKYFPTEAKKRMMELIDNLDKSYQNHIKTLDWMSDSTKQKALAKLSTITRKIGFPDKWKDYSSIDIDKNNLFKSAVNAGRYQYL